MCVCRCVAQEDMHCTWSGPPSSSSEESGELQDSSVSPSPPSPRRAYKGQNIEKLSVNRFFLMAMKSRMMSYRSCRMRLGSFL